MSYTVLCHNEVNIIGRIYRVGAVCRVNNQPAVKVCIALPNDTDYNLKPNMAYVYFMINNNKILRRLIGQAVGINGHIECNYGQRIIVNVMSIIKEKDNLKTIR